MGPLTHERIETTRVRRALASRDVRAWVAVCLVALAVVLTVSGVLLFRREEPATLLLGAAIVMLQTAWTLTGRVRAGGPLPADVLRLVTHTFFWLTLLLGVVIVVTGRVPFMGQTLETSPGQNVATDLGNALLGGLIVSAVLIAMQLAQQRRDDHAANLVRRQSARSTMLLMLGLERDLSNVDLSDLDLSWFSLRNRVMSGSRFRRACMFRSNLEQCDLRKSELNDTDLTNTFLFGANLEGAHLHRAVLDHAHLKAADLSHASLFGCSLRDVKLQGARLCGADLRAADLRGATVEDADFSDATFDRRTLFPDGFNPADQGMILDNSLPRGDLTKPTGQPICGADHDAEREVWAAQQSEAEAAFARKLDQRLH